MKYLTRPAEGPAKTLSDDPLETPPVFQTGDPQEAIKEVITRAGGGAPVSIGIAPGVELNPLGTIEDQDPSIQGQLDVGGGKLGFGVGKDKSFIQFRKQFDEGGLVELRKIFQKFKGKYPGLTLSLDTRATPTIRVATKSPYKKFLEGKKKNFSINEINELEKTLSKYSKIISPKLTKSLEERQKRLQEGRKKSGVKGKYGDRAEVKKQINKIIEEIADSKRPIKDISRLFRGELIDTELTSKNFLTLDSRTNKPLYLSDKNFKILKEK